MKFVGRNMQLLALVVLPILLFAFSNASVWLFASLGLCIAVFLIGRILEGYAVK
jgi:hypothetical protein